MALRISQERQRRDRLLRSRNDTSEQSLKMACDPADGCCIEQIGIVLKGCVQAPVDFGHDQREVELRRLLLESNRFERKFPSITLAPLSPIASAPRPS